VTGVRRRLPSAEGVAAVALLGTGFVVVLAWVTAVSVLVLFLAHRL
jgi:hypothetical protein